MHNENNHVSDELFQSAEDAAEKADRHHMEPTEQERRELEERDQQDAYDFAHELRAAWWGKPHMTEEELDDWLATRL